MSALSKWVRNFSEVKIDEDTVVTAQQIKELQKRNALLEKVITHKLAAKADARLVIDTFLDAFAKRGYPQGLMFHSDRGVQYTSLAFRKVLDNCHVVQSFSKKEHPYDNAVAECFFKYLKLEETNRRFFKNFDEPYLSVFAYIDGYYNSKRPHSSLGLLTPNQFEQKFFSAYNN